MIDEQQFEHLELRLAHTEHKILILQAALETLSNDLSLSDQTRNDLAFKAQELLTSM